LDTSNQRPDLLAPVHGTAETGTRILAMLEHGNRLPGKMSQVQRWHLDGWTAGMGAAVLVMAALAWMSREAAIKGGSGRPLAVSSIGSSGLSAPVRNAAMPATATPAQEPSAATIVSLVEPPPPTLARAAAAPRAVASANLVAQTTPAHTAPPSLPISLAAKQAITAPSRSATANTSASARDTAAARATASGATPDTDVALLAALVAHTGTPASVSPERSRDVVLPQEGEGTTLLLARCKQLGLIEGMLCRSRICSGRWENDPACRAPNH